MKKHWIVYFKWANHMVCDLHLNKAVKKKDWRQYKDIFRYEKIKITHGQQACIVRNVKGRSPGWEEITRWRLESTESNDKHWKQLKKEVSLKYRFR